MTNTFKFELTESEISDVAEALNTGAMVAYKLADEYELAGRLQAYIDAQTERGNRLSRLVGKVLKAKCDTIARETPGRSYVDLSDLNLAAQEHDAELDQEEAIERARNA